MNKLLQWKRGPRKVLAEYKTKEIFDFYKAKCEKEEVEPQSKQVFMEILRVVYPEIINLIIFQNLEFRMPGRLGYLQIRKKLVEPKLDKDGNLDTRSLSINWKKTKQLWSKLYPNKNNVEIKKIKDKPIIRELNEHTDNYRFLWYWNRVTCNIPNQIAYSLKMTRTHSRLLSKIVKTLNFDKDYYEF